jgi:hypothetical protein
MELIFTIFGVFVVASRTYARLIPFRLRHSQNILANFLSSFCLLLQKTVRWTHLSPHEMRHPLSSLLAYIANGSLSLRALVVACHLSLSSSSSLIAAPPPRRRLRVDVFSKSVRLRRRASSLFFFAYPTSSDFRSTTAPHRQRGCVRQEERAVWGTT